MPNGTVKFFNAAKGFGFITSDAGGKDIFVPTASLSASGLAALKPGQRLSFEELPDSKGPKAVNLSLLAEAPRPKIAKDFPKPLPRIEEAPQLAFYHDHTSEWSGQMLEEIRELGHQPAVVEYLETPPSKDKLRALSRLLAAKGQSLVRKYDPLFLELRLDDRFIGDNEFWEAIVENPALINGPLLATDAKASICHSDDAVAEFFAATSSAGEQQTVAKPKGLSTRALQILAGNAVPPILKAEKAEAAKPMIAQMPSKADLPAPEKAGAVPAGPDPVKLKLQTIARAQPKVAAKAQPKAKVASKATLKATAKIPAKPKAGAAGPGKVSKSAKNAAGRTAKRR